LPAALCLLQLFVGIVDRSSTIDATLQMTHEGHISQSRQSLPRTVVIRSIVDSGSNMQCVC